MSGYDICLNIVDGMIEYYNELEPKATLTAVDMQNFYSRMLPLLTELDSIMIREATVKGELNGKYNFYDEMYSILMSYLYDNGDSPIYDLGDYLGALSAPQTEFDNLDIEDIELLRNAYTDTALQLLEILNDYDNDGDDAIYADWTFCSYIMVEGGFVRFIDGEFIEQDENGYIPAFTTGLSIELCDGNTRRIDDYVNRVKEMTEILPDGEVKDYLRSRIASVSCYTAILLTGKYIGSLSAESGKDYISYDDILEAMKNKTDDKGKKICDYFMRLYDNLVWSGVFETVDDAEST